MSNDASEMMGCDPQFLVERTLRPYPTYQAVYQGHIVTTAIALSEGGVALDEQAGEPGYDPRLMKGLEVTMGSHCVLWFPNITWIGDDGFHPYVYSWFWRMRNAYDFRQRFRKPYHFPKQAQGVPDTVTLPGARVVIPAGAPSVLYVQAEGGDLAVATQNLHVENVHQGGANMGLAVLNPDGTAGVLQQGILAAGIGDLHTRAGFTLHEMRCVGDELILMVSRENPQGGPMPTWLRYSTRTSRTLASTR